MLERCNKLKLETDAYEARLCADPADAEWLLLESLCTNNETYFFREHQTLQWLVEFCLQRESVRIWSAGCSTGEEAYSLATLMQEAGHPDFQILGSDIDIEAIRIALQRTYLQRRLRTLPDNLEQSLPSEETSVPGQFRLKPFPQVHFHRANLLNPKFAQSMGPFDAILCRNLFIYLTEEAQKRVLDTFHHSLVTGGVLVLGVCESLCSLKSDFLHKVEGGTSVYVKEGRTDAPR